MDYVFILFINSIGHSIKVHLQIRSLLHHVMIKQYKLLKLYNPSYKIFIYDYTNKEMNSWAMAKR